MKRPWHFAALSTALVSSALVQAQTVTEGAPRYVAPSKLTQTGQAPGMKVQLLSDESGQKEYAVIFSTGDEAYSGLKESLRGSTTFPADTERSVEQRSPGLTRAGNATN